MSRAPAAARRGRRGAGRPARTGPWLGREIELDVGPVAPGGHCVARHEGRVVFVRHALPGERVVALVTEDRGGGFCRADAVRVLDRVAGPGRRRPARTPARAGAAAATGSTPARTRSARSRRRWCASS